MMLFAMHNAMLDALKALPAGNETIDTYEQRWNDTLHGLSKAFPCPACFAAGVKDAELKALPARTNTHYVKCKSCNREYSYIDDHIDDDC